MPPFDHLDVRQALNYAVDRRVALRAWHGSARPTCQVLPPNFPGYKPYCPYTLDRSPVGAPDLSRARVLVNRSGTRGTRVVISIGRSNGDLRVARYLATVLHGLGFPTSVQVLADDRYFAAIGNHDGGLQAAIGGWIADYPTPGDFFRPLFTCVAAHITRFCDHRVDALVAKAERAQATDPEQVSGLWTRLDRDVTDRAPWVFLLNGTTDRVVSGRVGNYQFSPVFGLLFDQLWVR